MEEGTAKVGRGKRTAKKTQSKVWRHMATPLEMDSIVLSQTRGRKKYAFPIQPSSSFRLSNEARIAITTDEEAVIVRNESF